MKGLSLIGALLGGLVGALIWLVAVAVDGSPLGIFALFVGAGVAAGAILLNSTRNGAVPAAIITLLFCLAAKFGGVPIALDGARTEIKPEFELKQYDMFMADAASWSRMDEAARNQYLLGRSPYDADRDGTMSASEQEVFNQFWAPRLSQWAANQPLFETWRTQLTADWGQLSGTNVDAKGMLAQFFAPLQLVFMLLAVVGAHQAVARVSLEEVRARKAGTGKIQAGVFDLNEDIGSGVDIKVAAPGQSARAPAAKPEAKPAAKTPAKPEAKPAAKPAPKKQDRPPGM